MRAVLPGMTSLGSNSSVKEKKKERSALAGFFGSSDKKDKDKDKDKKDRPGSFIGGIGAAPMMKIPPPTFKKPGPPNRQASHMDGPIRPTPKTFARPTSQVLEDSSEETTPSPPLNLQSKLRPTPKPAPKQSFDMTTASGTALRKLAAPPVTGIPKSPTAKRAAPPSPG